MQNYLDDITPEMTATVDKLKANNFEGATPEEIETYAQFVSLTSAQRKETEYRKEIMERQSIEQLELDKKQAQSAINALDALTELAKAKLKAVENES